MIPFERLKTLLQYVLPHHALSRAVGYVARCQQPVIKNTLINWFIKRYGVDMSIAAISDPQLYSDFNHFFTRTLKPGARCFSDNNSELPSPVDGTISQLGTIAAEGRLFQAKGFNFTTTELLGGLTSDAAPFANGQFATIYLSPKDYHRIHMPIAGKLTKMIHIPGRLFSVNPTTTCHVPRLFARNERVVCLFDSPQGPFAMVLVGAMIVASIATRWHGIVTPPKRQQVTTWDYQHQTPIELARGEELGQFQLGSTIIMLYGPHQVTWHPQLKANTPVQLGQTLGTLVS